jgi:hypothetical protein
MLIPFGVFSAAGAGSTGSYDLISSTILGSNQASVTFNLTGLSATYKHLQIRAVTRGSVNNAGDNQYLQFNSDTTYTDYRTHILYGTGSAVASGDRQTSAYPGATSAYNTADASYAANVYSPWVTDILDPFSTTKNKTTRTLSGGSFITLSSSVWLNTAALTSITIVPYSPSQQSTGSRFSLYGIKG